jgi:hypothetical protein
MAYGDASRKLTGKRYEAFAKIRAVLLRDVGLEPTLSDRKVLAALLPRYRRLSREIGSDIVLELTIVATLDRLGRKDEAVRLLEELERRYPGHPLLRRSR